MNYLIVILLLLFIVFILLKIRDYRLLKTVTKLNRGTRTERNLVVSLLKFGLPPTHIFHDLYLKKRTGNYSQIDLVAITKVGVLVFEVKSYSGWIFGNGNYNEWTQVLAYGKSKYRFYNPIKQNRKHVEDLKKELNLENIPFYSIIVFYGDCTLKDISFVPNGTYILKSERLNNVVKKILKNNEAIPFANQIEVTSVLKQAVMNGENREIQKMHVEKIKDMLGKHRIFD